MTASATYCNECGASNPLQATHCFACNNALQPRAPSPLLQDQASPTNAAVLTSKVIGPLVPSYLLHSRYNIVSQIGTGGFGAVYQAKDTLFSNRLVAITERELQWQMQRPIPSYSPNLGGTIYTYDTHSGVLAVAWSPNGQRIASGGKDHTVYVWPVALSESDGQLQKSSIIRYRRHAGSVQAVTWSPDSSYIASAGDNVQLWNGLTGEHIFTYTKHSTSIAQQVQAVAWSPNGRYIASGGMEGTVQVWNAR